LGSTFRKAHIEKGLKVGKSFGSYVEFPRPDSTVGLGLYRRAAPAKDARVPEAGTGSHRLVINGDIASFIDSDGLVCESAAA
jgi:hypothetical protein